MLAAMGSCSAWLLAAAAATSLLACTPQAVAAPEPDAHAAPAPVARPAPRPARPPAPQLAIPEIDGLVADALATHRMPGCVIAVGRHDGLRFLRAYGQRALVPEREAMTEDTIFDLASLTKPIATASAIMVLAERGKLELTAPAARVLPELDRPATRRITVQDLLLHAAGLPIENPMRDFTQGPAAAITAMLRHDPVTPRGRFAYSDLGYLWLGELVRRAAGEPLDVFTRQTLFAPLGMRDTGFNPDPALLPRIAPTEVTDDRPEAPPASAPDDQRPPTPYSPWHPGGAFKLIHGVVHDPRAYRLGGVAGNAGLFSTARDLSRFARMLLGGGALDGVRVLSAQSVATMTRPHALGDSVRALGWDIHSRYSRLRGTLLSPHAFGHGGFTGTSLFIDPERDLFVVLLSNRVHPDGKGSVISLAAAVTDAAVRALQRDAADRAAKPGASEASPTAESEPALPGDKTPVRAGIDVLRASGYARLQGKRVGLLTHLAARAADGQTTLALLEHAPGVRLGAVFSPEHGLDVSHEGPVGDGRRPARGVPVYSLFGATRRPSAQMLQGLDVVVVDLVDVGVRFFTYMSTLHAMLEAAAGSGVPVLVLDRPDPLGGVAVEGPVLDPGIHSFVNHYPLPIRHGMSAGELAALISDGEHLGGALQVVPAVGWCRQQMFAQTGLRWSPPSPNLPSADAALLYPATGLLEGTNLSVGRGTQSPFGLLGAPWIDAGALASRVAAAGLPGVHIEAAAFTPSRAPYAGQRCFGLRLTVEDPRAFRPVRTGLEIAHALLALHRDRWHTDKLIDLLGHAASLQALLAGEPVARIEALWQPALERFLHVRQRFLRYPSCEGARAP